MITDKYANQKYVILIGAVFFISIICSTIIKPNIIDIIYLILCFIMVIRYIMICITK